MGVSGRSRAIEIFDFEKDDLVSDDVMILDTGREIIVWVGSDATSEERSVSVKMAEQYLDADPSPRDSSNTVILQVKEGAETSHFNSFFKSKNGNKNSAFSYMLKFLKRRKVYKGYLLDKCQWNCFLSLFLSFTRVCKHTKETLNDKFCKMCTILMHIFTYFITLLIFYCNSHI